MTRSSSKISHQISGEYFIISLNDPNTLNSMTGEDYVYLATLLQEADRNDAIYFTVLQSSGRFFSSGANVSNIGKAQKSESASGETGKWLSEFVSRNLFVTQIFSNHRKLLICCLNGPAVGLSATIVMLCDIVYSMNDSVYLLFPFTTLGLVSEGALSVTLPLKLGYNVANEILTFGKPVTFENMIGKVIIKNYNMKDTNEFNKKVVEDLRERTQHLYKDSIIGIKKLLKRPFESELKRANVDEVSDALDFWVKGIPQEKFKQLSKKERRHKM
ncbi:LAFE_0C08020g1_1 [Lachancea fermentati]|uniref:LAFE_0C08020g1_1 n=1 Tax=Lachancea fermentati TaxID=4955 RepID=A0A1G4M9W2_LACFM|nr:LAFE_0C08020g1_1 [Lachancea fermentati]